jgi:DNA-binding transcriptional LysR family regulator
LSARSLRASLPLKSRQRQVQYSRESRWIANTAPQDYDRYCTTVLRMRKTTNLDDISIFVAAAEAGTFSAVATHLQLPASTISRALTRLEKHLDLLLVRRSQRGLALPDAGKEYLISCKRALRVLREGRELLDKHRANPSGLLRVACPITMARDAIAPLLSKFIEAFPDLRIELETYSSAFDQEPKEDIDVFFQGSFAQRLVAADPDLSGCGARTVYEP